MRSLRNARQSGNKQKLFMSEIQLFFITDITNLVFAYEHPLNEEWENKLLGSVEHSKLQPMISKG